MFLAMASRPIPVEQDAGRFRPVDKPFVLGDNSRLRSLGWAPRAAMEQSLAAVLDYWRGQSSALPLDGPGRARLTRAGCQTGRS
jgi:nucleoside-diphosphate-sugar epimerase